MARGRGLRPGPPRGARARGVSLGRRALLAGLALPVVARAQQQQDLRTLARRAAVFLAPLHAAYVRRHRDVVERGQRLNRLSRQLSPQNHVLPAATWLDLSGEPMFLTLPAMDGRAYGVALIDPFGRTFAALDRRLDGDTPRPQLLAGPAWPGVAPFEAQAIRAPARSVRLRYGLAVTDDDDDVDDARGLQARTLLETPDERNQRRILEMQELMRFRTDLPPEPVADWDPPRPTEPFDLFETGLAMLGTCALSERDRQALDELAPLHLRPGRRFDARAFGEADRTAIVQGIADAADEIAAAKAALDAPIRVE